MPKRVRQIGTFTAQDSKARTITLAIFQEFPDAGIMDNTEAERAGRKFVMTTDGRGVDKIGTRQYRVKGSAEILTTDDWDAP